MEKLQAASEEELQAVSAIGPRIAGSITGFFRDKHNRAIIRALRDAGVTMTASSSRRQGMFSNKTFVLTGTLSGYTRDEARRLIESHNGKVASAVSKNVDFVLAGVDAGSKLVKARTLGLRIISEEEFNTMVRRHA
jgi:DNA ligase (NAD+)